MSGVIEALQTALAFTSDRALPGLEAVLFDFRGPGGLTLHACDGFSMLRLRLEGVDAPGCEGLQVHVPVASVRAIADFCAGAGAFCAFDGEVSFITDAGAVFPIRPGPRLESSLLSLFTLEDVGAPARFDFQLLRRALDSLAPLLPHSSRHGVIEELTMATRRAGASSWLVASARLSSSLTMITAADIVIGGLDTDAH